MKTKLAIILLALLAANAHAQKLIKAPLVCIGDSVTVGRDAGDLNYCNRLGGINAGVGGNTTYQGLARFKEDVLKHNPKTITIGFGLNDPSNGIPVAQFRANMLQMVKLANPKRRRIILLTPNPRPVAYLGETKEQLNTKLYPYVLEIRRIAKHYDLPVIDVYQRFAEIGLQKDLTSYYADIIHPNALGHDVIFNLVKKHKQ